MNRTLYSNCWVSRMSPTNVIHLPCASSNKSRANFNVNESKTCSKVHRSLKMGKLLNDTDMSTMLSLNRKLSPI